MLAYVFLPGGSPVHPQASADPGNRPLVITHVTVIDATGSPAQPDMTVTIEKDLIVAIDKNGSSNAPQNAQVVDATGKFLIPGLVDMHVHTAWDPYFVGPLTIANGVTGVRDMFAYDLPAIQEQRREVAEGNVPEPGILSAGAMVDGPDGPWPAATVVKDAGEARAAVDRIKNEGYDFVKVYSSLNRETYFAIADEAKRVGIPFAGHVPGSIRVSEASEAGQHSIEHLLGISLETSNREEQLRNAPSSAANTPAGYFAEEKAGLDSYEESKASALFEQFRQNGTWQVPTLVVMRNAALYGDSEYVQNLSSSSRLRYVPYSLKIMWNLGLRFSPKMTPEQLEISRRYFEWELHTVGEMQRIGVGILAGTDAPNPYVYPGFGLHDELVLLVQAGLTPMQALQAATRNPAQFLGKLGSIGTIEKGKIANLDLLDANPLEDIHNTRTLYVVILRGKMIPKSGLAALLARAESNRWRANPAAATLFGLVLHRMGKVLLGMLGVLLAVFYGIYRLVKHWRRSVTRRI